MMKDELSHKRLLELAQAQSAHTSDPLPEVVRITHHVADHACMQ